MDFETAAKLSGARFVVLKKGLARMERALGQFMLDLHTNEHGYVEVAPPLLVQDEVMYGTAQLPKFAFDQFMTARNLVQYLETVDRQAEAHAASGGGRQARIDVDGQHHDSGRPGAVAGASGSSRPPKFHSRTSYGS